MQTLNEFINTWNGIPNVGDTPENKGQCVGLIECWTDNLGLPHTWGNAKDLLTDANTNSFDVIRNDPQNLSQFPIAGDVIVLDGTWGNGNGHTGVIVHADGTTWTGFEQNNPAGSPPRVVTHSNYNGVIGWLHPKVNNSAIITQEIPQEVTPEAVITDQTKIPQIGNMEVQAIHSLLNDQQTRLNSYTLQLATTQADLVTAKQVISTLQNELNSRPPAPVVPPAVELGQGSTQDVPQEPQVPITPSTTGFFAWLKKFLGL